MHRSVRATVLLIWTAVATLTIAGCDMAGQAHDSRSGNLQVPAQTTSAAPAPTSSEPRPHLTDYSALLLQAGDLSDADDTFTERPSDPPPAGTFPSASRFFVNADDTRAISVTVAVFPGAPAATAALQQQVAAASNEVVNPSPQPLPVGTDGTMIKGTSTAGNKAVTLVLFTQGPALARLQFASAPGDVTTDRFVTSIARMQDVALRVGIPATGG